MGEQPFCDESLGRGADTRAKQSPSFGCNTKSPELPRGRAVVTSGEDASTVAKIYTTVMLLLFFIPFSYLVDVFMYRMMSRRQQRARSSKS